MVVVRKGWEGWGEGGGGGALGLHTHCLEELHGLRSLLNGRSGANYARNLPHLRHAVTAGLN